MVRPRTVRTCKEGAAVVVNANGCDRKRRGHDSERGAIMMISGFYTRMKLEVEPETHHWHTLRRSRAPALHDGR